MKQYYDMIVRKIREPDEIKIYPIGDVHLGAAEHMTEEFEKWIAWIADQPNAYVFLVGDLINNATKSSVSNVYEEKLRPATQKRIMAELLSPIKKRILCCIPGNHEARSGKDADDDPTYDICSKLDIEDIYRPNLAIVKLQLGTGGRNNSSSSRPTYIFAVHHGAGGGMLTGSSVNRAERFNYIFDGVDGLIVGHSHKSFDTLPEKIKIDSRNEKIYRYPTLVVSCGSWMGYGGYAAQKQLLPAAAGPSAQSILTLTGTNKHISLSKTI